MPYTGHIWSLITGTIKKRKEKEVAIMKKKTFVILQ